MKFKLRSPQILPKKLICKLLSMLVTGLLIILQQPGRSFHRKQSTNFAKWMHTCKQHLPALVVQRSTKKNTDPVLFANISQPQFYQNQNSNFHPKFLCPLLRSKESFVYRLLPNLCFKFWPPCFSSVWRWFPRGMNCHRARGKSAVTRTCGPLHRYSFHRLCFPNRMQVWDMQSRASQGCLTLVPQCALNVLNRGFWFIIMARITASNFSQIIQYLVALQSNLKAFPSLIFLQPCEFSVMSPILHLGVAFQRSLIQIRR